jgi:serine/threonine-protein kinase
MTVAIALACVRTARPDEPDSELATQGLAVLTKYCYPCHGQGGKFEAGELDMSKREVLVGPPGQDQDKPYITPGKLDQSLIWERAAVKKNMPPKKEKRRPGSVDLEVLKRWIEAGLPFPRPPAAPTRPFRTNQDVLETIRGDLRKADRDDRPYLRYFTLTNLWNDKAISVGELRLAQAALAKLVNSLSWEREIVVPRAIDEDRTVLAIDLRALGWDRPGLWRQIAAANRYGLAFDSDRSREVRDLAEEVYRLAESKVPFVRVDWFLATASRAPLYDAILDLPDQAAALQRLLKVEVLSDFQRLKVARAGFSKSGVSSQNRVVERHAAAYGAYWQSYDFKPGNPRSNIFRLPLGPEVDDNPFGLEGTGFRPDGGEIIFNLPNGLQGYMLVNKDGKRISEAPAEVVHDRQMVTGSTIIVNGLSCMSCHKKGMIEELKDEVRSGHAFEGRPAEVLGLTSRK